MLFRKLQLNWKYGVSELLIVVAGVLIALYADDWRQGRADRELERNLLERLSVDLAADAADLAIAQTMVARRLLVLNALTGDLSDGVSEETFPQRPFVDSLDARADSLRRLAARGPGGPTSTNWDPIRAPLTTFVNLPEFDLSDDSYQEMLATGSLETVSDSRLRTSILRYYRTAEDMGENEQRAAEYRGRLEEAFSWIDVAVGDSLTLSELTFRVTGEPRLQVEFRRAIQYIRLQLFFFGVLERSRSLIESELAEFRRAAGE